MIILHLATQKHPAALATAVTGLRRRLPALSRSLSKIKPQAAVATRMRHLVKVRLEVHVIGDAAMKKINAQYRKKPETTDVLSFSYLETTEPVFAHEPAGEIYISYQRARAQSRVNGLTDLAELMVLTVHGAMHILGYDHEKSPADEARMHKAELRVLSENGVNGALTGR